MGIDMTEEEKQKKTNEQLKEITKDWDDSMVVSGGLIDEEGNIVHLSLWSKDIHVSSRITEEERCQTQKQLEKK